MSYFSTRSLCIGSMLDLNMFLSCFLMLSFASNSYSYESTLYNPSCLAKGIKESAYWEATQNAFTFSFSGLDACYYYSNIIVSFFKLCAKFSLRLQERSKVVTCCSENRFCLLDGKISLKSPDHLFDPNFLDSMLYTIFFLPSVLSFFIWVA